MKSKRLEIALAILHIISGAVLIVFSVTLIELVAPTQDATPQVVSGQVNILITCILTMVVLITFGYSTVYKMSKDLD